MSLRARVLRSGERLIGRACRWLPEGEREERYAEWTAELAAVLDDPDGGPAALRAVRMFAFAADQRRGVRSWPARVRPVRQRLLSGADVSFVSLIALVGVLVSLLVGEIGYLVTATVAAGMAVPLAVGAGSGGFALLFVCVAVAGLRAALLERRRAERDGRSPREEA
ncbi:hypothetical protein RKE29_22760 [Streptomyces sp. B1866]|uniref:hypothetical protein n=1 Tax=Streptomyces sp. B1866 TaxID=3075431 RepID=UPI00288DC4B6|nr:hypothetical protein [Streptomyces sp. B1866]MDT3399432.1 hypothetical protein [Streptomyces sp. B1866]